VPRGEGHRWVCHRTSGSSDFHQRRDRGEKKGRSPCRGPGAPATNKGAFDPEKGWCCTMRCRCSLPGVFTRGEVAEQGAPRLSNTNFRKGRGPTSRGHHRHTGRRPNAVAVVSRRMGRITALGHQQGREARGGPLPTGMALGITPLIEGSESARKLGKIGGGCRC